MKDKLDLLPNTVLVKVPPNRLKKKPIKDTDTYKFRFLCRNHMAKVCRLPDKISNPRLRNHDIIHMHPNTCFTKTDENLYVVSIYDVEGISIWKQAFEQDY